MLKKTLCRAASMMLHRLAMNPSGKRWRQELDPVLMRLLYQASVMESLSTKLLRHRAVVKVALYASLAVSAVFYAGFSVKNDMYDYVTMQKTQLERSTEKLVYMLTGTDMERDAYKASLDSILKHKDYMRFVVYRDADIFVPESVPRKDLAAMLDAADEYDIPYRIFFRLLHAESRFKKDAKSEKGAYGYAQVMPATYAAFKDEVKNTGDKGVDRVYVAACMLRQLRDTYDSRPGDPWELALAAYNAGSGNVEKHGGVPPFKETRNYIAYILR